MKVVFVPSAAPRLIEENRGALDHVSRRADALCMREQTSAQPARDEDVLDGRVALRDERRHERPVPSIIEAPVGICPRAAIRAKVDEAVDIDKLTLRIDDIKPDVHIATTSMRAMWTHAATPTPGQVADGELRAWELLSHTSRTVLDERDELIGAVMLVAARMLDANVLGGDELAAMLQTPAVVPSDRDAWSNLAPALASAHLTRAGWRRRSTGDPLEPSAGFALLCIRRSLHEHVREDKHRHRDDACDADEPSHEEPEYRQMICSSTSSS